MSSSARRVVAAAVSAAMIGASALVAAPAAEAQGAYFYASSGGGPSSDYWRYHRHYRHYRTYNAGPAFGAGVFGFIAGAMLGAAVSHPYYYGYGGSGWCAAHYRTYKPATGTFTGYDGREHPCP